MSKLTKLISNPKLFFLDAVKKRDDKSVSNKKEDKLINKKSSPSQKLKIIKKNPQAYLNELVNFIESFDVNSIVLEKEYIWPYLRHHLWVQLYFLGFAKDARDIIPHRLQLGTNKNIPFQLRDRFKKKYGALEIDDINEDIHGVDFLFLTVLNATEQVELENGEIYYRIIDPIYEAALKIGTAKKVEFVKVNSPAVKKVNRYKYKPLLILPPHLARSGYAEPIQFHYRFFDLIIKNIPSINFTFDDIKNLIDWEMHTRDYYIQFLKKKRPKMLFLDGFHYHAPLISAARSLGIKTVDLQHGIQVGWNPLYNYWEELPSDGYQALPDYFFVWGQKEFDSIKKVFNAKSKHTPIIYGNPWLEKQVEYMPKLESRYIDRFKYYDVKFLLILQNQSEVPELYKELVEKSPNNYLWIVRHHPKGNMFKAEDFSEFPKGNIVISKHIDSISLSSLFEYVDVAISEGSTVSVEADYYGVKNIICSEDGMKNYSDEIENGQFFYANTYQDFNDCISTMDFNDRTSKVNTYFKVNLEEILAKVIRE